ncbi:MAG: hypothetical protein RL755_48 [Pseudomonadota bacterium]|jgi:hypothetical protein
MNTCKHFKPDHLTDKDNHGRCQLVEDYIKRGATTEQVVTVIHEKLNGATRMPTGAFLFTGCDSDKGCERFEA